MGRRLIWNLMIVVAALALGLGLSIKPWQNYREQQKTADRHSAEMREAEKRREDLMRRKVDLESSAGREQAARELGYTRPGEKPAEGPN